LGWGYLPSFFVTAFTKTNSVCILVYSVIPMIRLPCFGCTFV
jgi:hypothetical protein